MTFLCAVIFLDLLHLFAALVAYARPGLTAVRMALCHSALSLIATIGAESAMRDDAAGITAWCLGLFAIASAALLAVRLYRVVGTKEPGRAGWRLGLLLWGQMAALYVGYAVFDHAMFLHGSTAAIMDPARLGIRDKTCPVAVIPWRLSGDQLRYRCIHNVVLSPASSAPFVPWPAYREGTSPALGAGQQLPETATGAVR